jgi:hypothetical protein
MFRQFTASAIVSTTVAVFASTALYAGQIELTQPMQGASLREPGIDMVVYYTEKGDALEVVATYIDTGKPTEPLRLRMALNDGDNVTFGLPGFRHTAFNFERSADRVTVRSETKPTKLARK